MFIIIIIILTTTVTDTPITNVIIPGTLNSHTPNTKTRHSPQPYTISISYYLLKDETYLTNSPVAGPKGPTPQIRQLST